MKKHFTSILLSLLYSLSFSGNPICSDTGFVKTDVSTLTGTEASAIGDFNKDGIPDIVCSSASANEVFIALGNSSGFSTPTILNTNGQLPGALLVNDLDQDGNQDLAITQSSSNGTSPAVGIYIGDGTGGFTYKTSYSSGLYTTDITMDDFDKDGKNDLATVSINDGVFIYYGNGDGTFSLKMLNKGMGNSIATGDFDGDGSRDFVVSSVADHSVNLYLNMGNKAFSLKTVYVSDFDPYSIAAADINGDRFLDIVTSNTDNNDPNNGSLDVFLFANGSYEHKHIIAKELNHSYLSLNDFDGDGSIDAAVTNYVDNTLAVLMGEHNGNFVLRKTYTTNSAPLKVISGDLNLDGRQDIVVANSNTASNNFSVFYATCNVITTAKQQEFNDLVKAYPSISSGTVQIEAPEHIDAINITTVSGQQVAQMQPQSASTSLNIENEGMYIVHIVSKSATVTQKIQIKK